MQRLENYTLQTFLNSFIKELKRENENREYKNIMKLNIPFIISSLYQSFKNNEDSYKEFVEDLKKYDDYNISIDDSANDYNGIIDVHVGLVKYVERNDSDFAYDDYDYPDYNYEFEFAYDERNWGYCECTPDMDDYREDKHCCGHGCDASFCEFELHKILHITKDTWHGDEHDYWDFEDEFYASDKELEEKKSKEDKERKIRNLKETIEEATKKLAELEGVD